MAKVLPASPGSAALKILQSLSSRESVIKRHQKRRSDFGMTLAHAEILWEHYLQFMVVKAFGNDSGPKMKYSTAPEVDEVWHTHLLCT